MIIDIFLYLFGTMIGWISFLLPDFSIYDQELLDGISFFGQKIAALDIFIFDIPEILSIFLAAIYFETTIFIGHLIISIVNFFRGSGKIEV